MSYIESKQQRRWTCVRYAIMSCALLCVPCGAQKLLNEDVLRKSENVISAQKCIMEGDVAYGSSRYEEALKKYAQAFALLPSAPVVKDLRDATGERCGDAAVARAQELQRSGDISGALALCNQVLNSEMAPHHGPAMAMRNQLQDPLHTNPAVTAQHGKDVDQVRRLLYKADGFYQLGKFDDAKKSFEEILLIDAHNTAARRGLEKVAAAKSDYQRTAFDHTRSEMLNDVAANWAMPVAPLGNPLMENPTSTGEAVAALIPERMAKMIIPFINLEDASLDEAIDYLRAQSRALDSSTLDPALKKGFNILINLGNDPQGPGAAIAAKRINLKLQNVPFYVVLQMICDQVSAKYTVGDYVITVRPAAADVREFVVRTYKVSPNFLSTESVAAQQSTDDIFAQDDSAKESLTPRKMSAEKKLKELGVPFPEGAFANYSAATSSLTVRNTTDAQDMVQNLVDMEAQIEPIQVKIGVKVIKIQNVELAELGIDWIFNDLAVGGGLTIGGGSVGSGQAITDISNGALIPAPVTSGLRSGDTAAVPSSIDELIRNATSGFSSTPQRAPGFLSVLGQDLNGSRVAMMMRGMSQKKGVDVMVEPSTMARSGQTSKIEIIREFPYATTYEPPQIPQAVGGGAAPITPAHPVDFERRNVGVTLEVSPVVSPDRKYVELLINQELVNFDGFVNYGSPINSGQSTVANVTDPPAGAVTAQGGSGNQLTANRILMPIFSKIGSNTSVSIADGATIVLGGLMEERIQKVEDQVPFLGSIPLIGKSFQSNVLQPVKTTILIMVTVDLQDPAAGLYRDR